MGRVRLVKAASLIMFMTLISKIIGFLRDMLIAGSFGTTYQTDAYNMAITIPEILFALFSLAITTTFIPVLSDIYNNKGKEDMFSFFNNIMNLIIIISLILTALGLVFAPQLVKIIAPKFEGETYSLTVKLVRISTINIVFMSLTGGYTALLQTFDDFVGPAVIGMMLNLPIIIYILSGARAGVIGLTAATVVGNALEALVLIPWLFKHDYKYRFFIDVKDDRIKKIIMLIMPVIVGAGVKQLNAIVEKTIGSGLPQGSISALNFAGRVTDVVYVTFATAVVTVVYPALSREGSSRNFDEFKFYINKAVNNISLIMLPCTFGLISLSVPVVTVLFKHGVFDDRSVFMTSTALIYYSIGLPFYGIRDVFNRALYALKDTKTSTINGLIGVGINIILNLILVPYMGIGGLALSTSIVAIVTMVLLFLSLRSRAGDINLKEALITIIKIGVSSIIMGVLVYLIYNLVSVNGVIFGLVTSVTAGVIIYAVQLKLLKVEEFDSALEQIKHKIKG